MLTPKHLLPARLTIIILTCTLPGIAQKRVTRPKPAPKPAIVQQASFDNLLSADRYKIYVEIRNVGQLVSSSSFNEVLEPVLKLAAPPKEFRTAVKWLTAHADTVTTSRMMLATWPTAKNVPSVLVAIEFETVEAAAKFEPQLSDVLRRVLPPTATPTPSSSPGPQKSVSADLGDSVSSQSTVNVTKPDYYLLRSGALVFVTSSPLTLKNLKPVNSKPLIEDQNFRMAYDRFTSESIFAYVNTNAIDQEEKERQEADRKRIEKQAQEASKAAEATQEEAPGAEEPPDSAHDTFTTMVLSEEAQTPPPAPDPMAMAMSHIMGAFFGGFGEMRWPEAIGIAGNLDPGSFDARVLLITSQAEKAVAIPFFPALVSGPVIVPESPSILPADSELFVTMSLDLPQVYAALTRPIPQWRAGPVVESTAEVEPESPFAFIEKKLGMKLQDGLLPLLGNEVVFSMPVATGATVPDQKTRVTASGSAEGDNFTLTETVRSQTPSPTIALSLRDKEGIRVLLPKLIDALGFKGASGLAQTERRDDTEVVTYANILSYAFIGNFLVISPDVKNIKHVVDSYLKRDTLSSDINFKNSTRWQPRQLQGQVYISPALMESYRKWANEPSTVMTDQTREFLSRLTVAAEPVTYSLSNEGNGPLHQLRVPKNLLLMAVAGMSAESNQPPMVANERATMGALYFIAHTESSAHLEKGSYLSLDELISQKKIQKELIEGHGYRIEVNIIGDGYEAVAVPIEYGKSGKLSFFVNESGVVRAADHAGAPATLADKPVH
jgi:hypothetical protein